MKNSITAIFLLLILGTSACKVELFSCLKGEGEVVTRTVSIADIRGIDIDINAEVVIKEGEAQVIEIRTFPNVIDRILDHSKINGERWDINLKGCTNVSDVQFFITLPTIKEVAINGSVQVRTEGIFRNIEKLNLEIDGDGDIDFKLASVSKVDMQINGNGEIRVSGATDDQSIDISGTGVIRNFDLMSNSTNLKIKGVADCNISVSDILFADLAGDGRICYRGNPTLNLDNSGTVEVVDCN